MSDPGTSRHSDNVNLQRGTKVNSKIKESQQLTPTGTSELLKEIRELRQEIAAVKQQNSVISLELSDLNDSIKNKFDILEKQLEEKDIEIFNLKTTLSGLQSALNQQEQFSLRNELEIQGIPEVSPENLTHTVLTLSQKLNVELKETDINSITRAGSKLTSKDKTSHPRPIVVQFVRKAKKDELLAAARIRKNLTTEFILPDRHPINIYLNERLTKINRLLFREARTRKTLHGFRYCWIKNGSIFMRKTDNKGADKSPAIPIKSIDDLDKHVGPTAQP
ncbi:hypothetical protein O0L34_g9628 [Tuta absoluta]|nr:hypothetical protein O0L34_g9628 [Tuta absoluta]